MLTIAEIMCHKVATIRSSATVTQAIALMQEKKVRSLVVEKAAQGGAYGIITERDIIYKVMARAADPFRIRIGEIMTNPCIALSTEIGVREAAQCLRAANIQQAPVITDGHLVGTVSITDIIRHSNVDAIYLPTAWAENIETTLRQKQLCWGNECQLDADNKVAKQVLAELQPTA